MGEVLNGLLEKVLENPEINKKEVLLDLAKGMFQYETDIVLIDKDQAFCQKRLDVSPTIEDKEIMCLLVLNMLNN